MLNIEKKYIKREIFEKIASHLDKPEITLITGSRQVGKTVLLEQLKNYLVNKKKVSKDLILYYNLDLVQDWEDLQDQTKFIEFLKDRSQKQKIYVFIDEAQKVPEAARFFKGIYDTKLNVKLVLTGSSSLEIKAKFKETLAGRKMLFYVSSFTFLEFLRCKDSVLINYFLKNGKKINEIDQKKMVRHYKEYITFGGYPRVVLSKTKEDKINILKEIYSSYIEKDAIGFLAIKNKAAFNRLIKLLAAQVGQLVNIEELASNLNIDRHSVERYIFALEESFIVKRVVPYYKNPRQEIVKANKVYFLDCGIRNLSLENFEDLDERTDRGLIFENAVFSALLFLQETGITKLHFWRTKQKTEVDFVIERGLDLLPIEVKFISKKNIIPTGLRGFIEKFHPKKALVVNFSLSNNGVAINNTKINFIYPFELNHDQLLRTN